ncbi:metallophosphoesterase [Halomicronema hongdechloris C2206]|uniref:Metallophosphoesterase n=1 Tax=Halomicronema hongdechloris C2206 TaxID=1641165 RepID=A0A1Z3HPS4_9CYAN|nr:metallophosphoesterase [Halomicronema hongdechloris]ASC72242.1 metallophosphoesterase [Halomicronema hongdechloris C2206]
MAKREDLTLLVAGLLLVLTTALLVTMYPRLSPRIQTEETPAVSSGLLTDPFLQNPTPTSVRVVWFTEFAGRDHAVVAGSGLPQGEPEQWRAIATTTQLSRMREDSDSQVTLADVTVADLKAPIHRPIWRHEAELTGLPTGQRIPYRVISLREDGELIRSELFTLSAAPAAGQPLTILLTSDHQLKPMTPANLQQVAETAGQVDAIFMAGDLVNIPDRASEWFDDNQGYAFFPCLQGRAHYALTHADQTTLYRGGELIQHAPLFPAIGNHEVMGRYSMATSLGEQFNDPVPRSAAIQLYQDHAEVFNPTDSEPLRRQWIVDNSFNSDTYEEIFSLPRSTVPNPDRPEQTSRYYAVTFGDVRLISLYVTRIWRQPDVGFNTRGRYRERAADLHNPGAWGHGNHIFEPITPGSWQYQWLQRELASDAFRQAKYKIVMLHHPPHSLGDNVVPPFTEPVRRFDRQDNGQLQAIRYEYPRQDDYLGRDLMPLLEQAGVNLVLYGHSHIWNRFVSPGGMHFLETSNVGNTYGAYWQEQQRQIPPAEANGDLRYGYRQDYYAASGDPNGLRPQIPTVAPLTNEQGDPLPYIASNDITAFSLLDTESGTVSSYYFDTRAPESEVVKFDEFSLGTSSASNETSVVSPE